MWPPAGVNPTNALFVNHQAVGPEVVSRWTLQNLHVYPGFAAALAVESEAVEVSRFDFAAGNPANGFSQKRDGMWKDMPPWSWLRR